MADPLFYPVDNPYKSDKKKTEFVACRMDRELFYQLSKKAKEQNSDLSSIIRELCRNGLQQQE